MRRLTIISATLLSFALPAASCVHVVEVTPAANAQHIPGMKNAAFNEAGGIRVSARTDAWHGDPPDLREVLTPVEVAVENHGNHRIRIVYSDFGVITPNGYRLSALPAYNLKPEQPSAARQMDAHVVLAEAHSTDQDTAVQQGSVAPRNAQFYPGPAVPLWNTYAWGYWPYYDYYYYYWPRPLPTAQMVQAGLPEGAVEAGGFVRGFLYFPALRRGQYDVIFTMEIHDADTNEQLGTINIPFSVR
jgi:hypothetical protein